MVNGRLVNAQGKRTEKGLYKKTLWTGPRMSLTLLDPLQVTPTPTVTVCLMWMVVMMIRPRDNGTGVSLSLDRWIFHSCRDHYDHDVCGLVQTYSEYEQVARRRWVEPRPT
jgi:hypothetical protein